MGIQDCPYWLGSSAHWFSIASRAQTFRRKDILRSRQSLRIESVRIYPPCDPIGRRENQHHYVPTLRGRPPSSSSIPAANGRQRQYSSPGRQTASAHVRLLSSSDRTSSHERAPHFPRRSSSPNDISSGAAISTAGPRNNSSGIDRRFSTFQ